MHREIAAESILNFAWTLPEFLEITCRCASDTRRLTSQRSLKTAATKQTGRAVFSDADSPAVLDVNE